LVDVRGIEPLAPCMQSIKTGSALKHRYSGTNLVRKPSDNPTKQGVGFRLPRCLLV